MKPNRKTKAIVYTLLFIGSILSLVPFFWMLTSSFKAPEFVFADPDGQPLANVAPGLRIRFGYAENSYVGLPEIEILGDLVRKNATLILMK